MSSEPQHPLDTRPPSVVPVALATLVSTVGATLAAAPAGASGASVTGVTLASSDVRPGDLYAALPGTRTHGARFAADAAQRGAVAVLTDAAGADLVAEAGVELPVVVVADARAVLGQVASQVYAAPSEGLTTIGITGTQGKTTSSYLAAAALRACGDRVGAIGTTGAFLDGRPLSSALTTPEAPALHALFGVMRDHGADAVVMEVSSHALALHRVDGVVYDVAVFLNLGRDHLDFHPDVEDYFAAKASLFTPERAGHAVVDIDDPYGRRLASSVTIPLTTVSLEGREEADWRVVSVESTATGSTARVVGPDESDHTLLVGLPGRFNVANALAVLAAVTATGRAVEDVLAGIAGCTAVPGRMESVDAGQDFTAIVDYAHKPDALRAVLASLRGLSDGRLVVVVGAGGDRDLGKRPLMGAAAAELADVVVVTDDNPRTEDPAQVRAAIIAGARSALVQGAAAELVEIGDRRAAIAHAVGAARPGDVVVVAGKGHERGQIVGDVVHPFDDREVLVELLGDVRRDRT
ncbi:UDP-N-acetylmuramoyl-L-alanyl-D-glutamate--2,6-diaminopimelate ligase [Mumia zhuanghuii]|uniref:UDP-N-acetylmuramoyl-L-alanyl-D-glutamate--2,6-diaminopimelate ligase n=2 Tax=Mumia TaxID=1546255 RepID=A0ABW1QL99_9ACTN|nr:MULTISPECIES: UDP-N-acetylmuramoyl-L-alanyl-D-glutamate--2,6-diaminopimelate ligase [Mumia]KAA1423477.1 UDP-N-acetylmuramoyl-L-alanyl-D-glutamate--2,6-diaminopimelate ligase [Mumia zhuanghuii]